MAAPPRKFEVLARRRVHQGFYRFDILELRHERFAGGWTHPLKRELLLQPDAVAVLPYDAKRDRVVLIEQFRVGALDAPDGPWLLEAVAGIIEEGETAEQVARREIREEAGLEAGRLERVGAYRSSPGGTSERVEVFIAEVEAPEEGGIFGLDAEQEDIRTLPMMAEEAFRLLGEGRITAATAVVPLLYLRAERARLRREWSGE